MASACAFVFTELTRLIETFHVVVMTVLRGADFALKSEHLLAVFAE